MIETYNPLKDTGNGWRAAVPYRVAVPRKQIADRAALHRTWEPDGEFHVTDEGPIVLFDFALYSDAEGLITLVHLGLQDSGEE